MVSADKINVRRITTKKSESKGRRRGQKKNYIITPSENQCIINHRSRNKAAKIFKSGNGHAR